MITYKIKYKSRKFLIFLILFLIRESIYAQITQESVVIPFEKNDSFTDFFDLNRDFKNSFLKIDLIKNKDEIFVKENFEKKEKNDNFKLDKDFNIYENNVSEFYKKSIEKEEKNDILNSKKNNEFKKDFIKLSFLSSFLVLILLIISFLILKLKKREGRYLSKQEKIMTIVSSLFISPKRQVLILKIRNQEIVVSNTENGISFLTEINRNEFFDKKCVVQEDRLIQNEKAQIQKIEENKVKEHVKKEKSENFLNSIKKVNLESFNKKEKKYEKNELFSKYITDKFEKESKKNLNYSEKDDNDGIESVTNLIREKLKSMKPLN
jgi:flagellar biogenesis protein FliO